MRALAIFLALTIAAPAFADTPDAPDEPKTVAAGSVITNPKDGTQFAAATDGAFITDAKAKAMANAFKRVVEERDGFKAKLESRPAYPVIIGVAAGSVVVGAVVAVLVTLAATNQPPFK